jgi:hypothetical protein
MKKNAHNPTMMIKCRFSNEIHKLITPCYGIKPHTKEHQECRINNKKNPLTDKEKVELFDKIMELDNKTSWELTHFFTKRKLKNKVNKIRTENGYFEKKKPIVVNQ